MKHVMLDLETWGTTPGSDIRSIGAVVFDFDTGPDLTRTFYVNCGQGESVGLTRDPATEQWWSEQEAAAQEALLIDRQPIWVALRQFAEWFASAGCKTVWSHGALFDVGLIEAAFRACVVDIPWDYRASRDTRTVFEFFPSVEIETTGVKHNALDDAVNQVRWIVESVKQGRVK